MKNEDIKTIMLLVLALYVWNYLKQYQQLVLIIKNIVEINL
jgi:hypothetical protein